MEDATFVLVEAVAARSGGVREIQAPTATPPVSVPLRLREQANLVVGARGQDEYLFLYFSWPVYLLPRTSVGPPLVNSWALGQQHRQVFTSGSLWITDKASVIFHHPRDSGHDRRQTRRARYT